MSTGSVLSGRRILVTGASGFIGRAVVARLLAEGAAVSVLVRGRHEGSGVTVHRGDLRRAGTLDRALAGQDVLVNLAHDMRAGADENLAAFDTLYAAARAAGTGYFVHAGSAVIYDAWPGGKIDETSPCATPGGGPYRQAKIAMETRLASGDLPATILQPTLVWGPGSAFWTTRFLDHLGRGGTVVLPEPCGRAPLVHVDDLARAFALAAARVAPGHARYLISGPAPVPWAELMSGYRRLAGHGSIRREPAAALHAALGPPPADHAAAPPAAARISAAARRLIGHARFEAMTGFARRLRPAGDLVPDRHLLDLMCADPCIATGAARDGLGFRAEIDLESGLRGLSASAG